MRRFIPERWRHLKIARVLPTLDSWHFWITLAFLILGGIAIATVLNRSSIGAEHNAREQAGISRVQTCLRARVALYPRLNGYFDGVAVMAHTLVENSEAMHEITPRGSAVYHAQERNLRRLRDAIKRVVRFRLPVPTIRQCEAERNG